MRPTGNRMLPAARTAGVWVGVLLVMLLSGCSQTTRHQVLAFFFTGVPPLEGDEEPEVAQEPVPVAALVQVGLPSRRPPEFWTHGPYAARDCDQCHASGQPGVPRFQGVQPRELCAKCHSAFVEAVKPGGDRWTHGPVASGNCTACHHPHRSPNRFMLRAEPARLCGQCHTPSSLERSPIHRGEDGTCLTCHDPHSGLSPALLTGRAVD